MSDGREVIVGVMAGGIVVVVLMFREKCRVR